MITVCITFKYLMNKFVLSLDLNIYNAAVGPKVEAQLVMQAIQMNTISKLTTSDKTLFQLLTRDIFVDVDFVEIENVDLYSNLEEVYKEQNFGILRSQVSIF